MGFGTFGLEFGFFSGEEKEKGEARGCGRRQWSGTALWTMEVPGWQHEFNGRWLLNGWKGSVGSGGDGFRARDTTRYLDT